MPSSPCVGTHSTSLSDALLVTSLPTRLREKQPDARYVTLRTGFNRKVFAHHPAVQQGYFSSRSRGTEALGDRVELGRPGLHAIQARELALGLTPSAQPKPELRLSEYERRHSAHFIQAHTQAEQKHKPLCILHAWSRKRPRGVAPVQLWDELVAARSADFRFWQVGLLHDSAIQGCDYYFMPKHGRRRSVRELFGLISQAQAFIGINAAPMHVARAFDIPSLILLDLKDPRDASAEQTELYPGLPTLAAGHAGWPASRAGALQGMSDFLAGTRTAGSAEGLAQGNAPATSKAQLGLN